MHQLPQLRMLDPLPSLVCLALKSCLLKLKVSLHERVATTTTTTTTTPQLVETAERESSEGSLAEGEEGESDDESDSESAESVENAAYAQAIASSSAAEYLLPKEYAAATA